MKKSKRKKINFKTEIGDEFKVIPKLKISESNERIRKHLTYGDVYKACGDFIIGNEEVIKVLKEAMK